MRRPLAVPSDSWCCASPVEGRRIVADYETIRFKVIIMKYLYQGLLACVLAVGSLVVPAFADNPEPLFVNLTTDDPHRARMGIMFGKNQFERGHPLTIFLNDRGVFIGANANAGVFAQHQQTLTELMSEGATVLICPMCMQHYGVAEDDLLSGLQMGNPELTGGALFRSGTRTLTW